MLELDNYRARMVDVEDLEFLNAIRLSSHVQDNVGVHLFTNNFLQKSWIENVSKSSKDKYLIFEIKGNDNRADNDTNNDTNNDANNNTDNTTNSWQKIGLIRLNDIDFINRSVCVGGDIAQEFIGKGYGKKMYEIIFKICFDIWGMNRLWLLVLAHNSRAINLYQKVGFTQEGIMRQAVFKNGKFADYILMSVLRSEAI